MRSVGKGSESVRLLSGTQSHIIYHLNPPSRRVVGDRFLTKDEVAERHGHDIAGGDYRFSCIRVIHEHSTHHQHYQSSGVNSLPI
jgi:hypothetical protein